ncbi:MAG: DUF839 domain-containing protein, partial [Proteobacteria bacterium]
MPVDAEISRRRFLAFMGQGAIGLTLAGSGVGALLNSCASSQPNGEARIPALKPSAEDKLRLSPGLSYEVVAAWGDELRPGGPRFGFNNDFIAYFPLAERPGEALLCVNHETPNPVFVSNYHDLSISKTRAQVELEMECTGMSVVHVKETAPGKWERVKDSPYHRLVNGKTMIPFTGAEPIAGAREAMGTLGNCAGGKTPWGTYLTCEENYDQFYGDTLFRPNGKRVRVSKEPANPWESFNWHNHFDFPSEHYGWVVEIDPRSGHAK